MNRLFISTIIAVSLISISACNKNNDAHLAQQRLDQARSCYQSGRRNQAKIEIDSIHALYPKEVAIRRQAKALSDSIQYDEAKRNLVYLDSVSQELTKERDVLLKQFIYDKSKYEDYGKYFHRNIYRSGSPHTTLQAYVDESAETFVRSYYVGSALNHRNISVLAGEVEQLAQGSLYTSGDGSVYYEITTISGDEALSLLNFISANVQNKITVRLSGNKSYNYNLTSTTIDALAATYHLGVVMRDLRSAKQQIVRNQAIVEKRER